MTEDADLGLRLIRFGYRTGTITRPTFEDAPDTLNVWIRQRTRWFKGWMQTWSVHNRRPLELLKNLGLLRSCVAQVLLAGIVVSTFIHPVSLAAIGLQVFFGNIHGLHALLMGLDIGGLLLAYLVFACLGWMAMTGLERSWLLAVMPLIPFYWLLQSVAAWRAIWQLVTNPHYWEKTPHRPHFGRPDLPAGPPLAAPTGAGSRHALG